MSPPPRAAGVRPSQLRCLLTSVDQIVAELGPFLDNPAQVGPEDANEGGDNVFVNVVYLERYERPPPAGGRELERLWPRGGELLGRRHGVQAVKRAGDEGPLVRLL